MPVAQAPSFNLAFQNEVVIYEQNVICHVKDNEFNLSYNPTLLQGNLQLCIRIILDRSDLCRLFLLFAGIICVYGHKLGNSNSTLTIFGSLGIS